MDVIRPDFQFLKVVEKASGQALSGCSRCLRCSAGCPMAADMDYLPDRLVRMVQLGLREPVLRSRAIWLCPGCMVCSDRCPSGIDVARVIDTLKAIVIAGNHAPGEPRIAAFHRGFLDVVRRLGRLHEASLIAALKLGSGDWLADLGVGLRMVLEGKILPLPGRVRGHQQIVELFRAAGRLPRPPDREGAG